MKFVLIVQTTGAYKAVSTVNGVGDHTWNDIQIVTAEQSKQLNSQKKTQVIGFL